MRAWSAIAAVAGVLALVSACSSGSSTASSTGATGSAGSSSASSQSGANGSPIVIGDIGTFSGEAASTAGPAEATIQTWVKYVNANGGLNGHPVKLDLIDDQVLASNSIAAAHELVGQDHVVAIVNDWSGFDSDWAAYVQQQGVPVLGGHNLNEFGLNPDFFPTGTTLQPLLSIAFKVANQAGATKLGSPYCDTTAACVGAVSLVKTAAAPWGSKVVWSGPFSDTASDYTPQCLAAKAAGANGMMIQAVTATTIRFTQSCEQQGFNPIQVTYAGIPGNAMLTQKSWQNAVAAESNAPWFDQTIPATKTFREAMQKYSPGTPITAAAIQAWAAGQMFKAAYETAGSPANVTSADIVDGLYKFKGQTLGGLAPPLTFERGKPADVTCGFVMRIENEQWVAPDGDKPVCLN